MRTPRINFTDVGPPPCEQCILKASCALSGATCKALRAYDTGLQEFPTRVPTVEYTVQCHLQDLQAEGITDEKSIYE